MPARAGMNRDQARRARDLLLARLHGGVERSVPGSSAGPGLGTRNPSQRVRTRRRGVDEALGTWAARHRLDADQLYNAAITVFVCIVGAAGIILTRPWVVAWIVRWWPGLYPRL